MIYNVNLNQCLRPAYDFGSTTFYNICDGSSHLVPWGNVDWTMSILGWSAGGLAIIFLAGTLYGLYQEIKGY